MNATPSTTTASDLLAQLDSKTLEERLDELSAERNALRVLWRAARAKERRQQRDVEATP